MPANQPDPLASIEPVSDSLLRMYAFCPNDEDDDRMEAIAKELLAAREALVSHVRQAAELSDILEETRDERDRLAAALVEACDLAIEIDAYTPDYFREKWDHAARIEALRKVAEGAE